MSENEYAVISTGITKRFGRKLVLDRVSAQVPVGTIYGLLGPNGAGKTTFIRCLLNLINPSSGSATVLGYDIMRDSIPIRKRVGHVAALQPLWEGMRVRELAAFMAGCYPQWNQGIVASICEHIGIDQNARLHTLSRGQRAVAALAVATGHEPELLLLDEALTGLDPIARREVLRSVIDAMHSQGRTVLITGQDIADMERICDWVGFLHKGKLILEAPLDALKADFKRIRVTHPPGAFPELPANALRIEQTARETQFTVPDFAAFTNTFTAAGCQVETIDLSLEDIFVDLAQPE